MRKYNFDKGIDETLRKFMEKVAKLPEFKNVEFVFLFGSRSDGSFRKDSDYDLAFFYKGTGKDRFKFRLRLSEDEKFDIKIFQDLPLYVRKEVLKGSLIYAKDEVFAYDVAYQTVKEFERFKKYYYDYVGRRSSLQ